MSPYRLCAKPPHARDESSLEASATRAVLGVCWLAYFCWLFSGVLQDLSDAMAIELVGAGMALILCSATLGRERAPVPQK
jgi:hypothetical protein